MDPKLQGSRIEEEHIQSSDGGAQQVTTRNTAANSDQVEETVSHETTTPTSQTTKTEHTVAASPSAASDFGKKKTLFHAYRIIWYLFAFIEIVLAFRFVLKLLGANPEAGFTKFVYALSAPFAGPFTNIFQDSTAQGVETTAFFEWSTLIAALVYIVITWAIIKIFKLGKPTDADEIISTVDSQ